MTTASRRAVLLAGASVALSGCGLRSCVDQSDRRAFKHHLPYTKSNAPIRAFTRGGDTFYSLEAGAAATETSGAMYDLCKVDLETGNAEVLRKVERASNLLAVSDKYAWLVLQLQVTGGDFLHRVALHGTDPPEKLFRVPSRPVVAADARGAWAYRAGSRATSDLVHITDSGVETLVQDVEPGELTVGGGGVFFTIDSGLHFIASGAEPIRIAEKGVIPIVGGDRALLSLNRRIVELELPSGSQGKPVGDASTVPGKPCAALFGGVLFADAGATGGGGLSRSGTGSIGLNFWEADKRGWVTAMTSSPGRMLFGAVHGASYVIATEGWVAQVS